MNSLTWDEYDPLPLSTWLAFSEYYSAVSIRRGVFVSATWVLGYPVSETGPPSSSQRNIFSIARLLFSDLEAGFTHASTLLWMREVKE